MSNLTPEQIRGKYWAIRDKIVKQGAETIDRQLALFICEMTSELAAQQAEQLVLLRSKIGLFNTEQIALELDKIFREKATRLRK